MMDLDFLRGLIDAVDESGIDSLEITRAGTRIRISKSPPAAMVAQHAGGTNHTPVVSHQIATQAGENPAATPEEVSAPPDLGLIEVKSPMVGTFYRAPAPEAPPYVESGSHISKGQTLCILEAMKLMNELESEVDGILREVLVENAEPVEYGQVLFLVEPTGKGT